MLHKVLGKIGSFSLGTEDCEKQETHLLDFHIKFITVKFDIKTSMNLWDKSSEEISEYTKWEKSNTADELSEMMYKISDLLHDAKKTNIDELVNIPIELIFEDDNTNDTRLLKSWRILTEVL